MKQVIQLEVLRRTFEAARHPQGSEERATANRSPLTSEYYTGSRYILVCSKGGEIAWTQLFKTKGEAERIKAGLEKAANREPN